MEAAGCTGEEGKPDAMILGFGPMFCGQQTDDGIVYVPNGELVGPQTPPAFSHHSRLDMLVSVYQTIAMIDAMERAKRPLCSIYFRYRRTWETSSVNRILAEDGTVGPCIDDWFEQAWRFLANQLGITQVPQKMPQIMPPMPPASGRRRISAAPMPIKRPGSEGSNPGKAREMPYLAGENLHMPLQYRLP